MAADVSETVDVESDGSSATFSDLDDDGFDLAGYREQRLDALKQEMDRARMMREGNHGRLTEIKDEKELMQTTAKAAFSVVHFYHKDFRRCAIMDKHLETLAARHFSTLFIKSDVANVPFLVERLELRILPCVICFVDGVSKERITGFDGLATGEDVDSFTTAALELRLKACGVLGGKESARPQATRYGFGTRQTGRD